MCLKHAFLIIAHKNYNQLDELIKLLDHDRVDIFLHIDSKSAIYSLPHTVHSRVIQIPRMRINWGGYSLVECELCLLKTALSNNSYSFFHLLSGQDLPIKPIDEILCFFDSHSDFNFIHYDTPAESLERNIRVKYYQPFQDIKPRGKRSVFSICDKVLVLLQSVLKIDRTQNYDGPFKSGSQWWSIGLELAKFIISQETQIKKMFKYTMCDEMFMQTIVFNSKYVDTLYRKEVNDPEANQRLIDFNRGKPYVWTINELEEIKNSNLLFARKFDDSLDYKIVREIVQLCNNGG